MHALAVLCVVALIEQTPADPAARATALVTAMSRGDYKAAGQDFDDAMQKAMPTDKLKTTWETVLQQVGPFQKQIGAWSEHVGQYDRIHVTCQFEKAALDVRIVFTGDQKVTGLGFLPARPPEYKAPAYVRAGSFHSSDVTVGKGTPWELPGTLTLPTGDGPFPGVVLVHGSGPNDRDEAIGPNRPFRDLAEGLASRGVAVLRYDKRTKHYGAKIADKAVLNAFTIKEETIDDAVAALAVLRSTPGVDPRRVFVLGHSLGGMLVPRIAAADGKVAGVVALAGATRPLGEVVLEQVAYINSLNGGPTDAQKAEYRKLEEQLARVNDPKLTVDTPAKDLLLGQPAAYWLSLRGLEPAKEAAALSVPFLVLQGERDYQVTLADFALWQAALAGKPTATLKRYPTLNHLFAEGTGKAVPTEYLREGHVAAAVVEDIANWIKR